MLRILERFFKRGLASLLRIFFHSSPPGDVASFSPSTILLIRQHNQMGDMLCVVPLLRALRARYPASKITLMASPVNYEIMLHSRYLDSVLLYDKSELLYKGRIRLKALTELVKSLWGKFDMAIVPGTVSTSFTSDLLAFLTRAHVRIGVASLNGRENPASFLFNVPVPLDWRGDPHRHQTLRNLDLMASYGLTTSDLRHEITLTEMECEGGQKKAARIRSGKRLLFGFHPGAGKPPNRWPTERFVELINLLLVRYDAAAFVTAGPMDEEVIDILLNTAKQSIELVENQSIRTVASIIKEANLYVSNDTGLLHVAAGIGAPLVGLFGPTDLLQWAPRGENIRSIQGKGGSIAEIEVEQVFRCANELLEKADR